MKAKDAPAIRVTLVIWGLLLGWWVVSEIVQHGYDWHNLAVTALAFVTILCFWLLVVIESE